MADALSLPTGEFASMQTSPSLDTAKQSDVSGFERAGNDLADRGRCPAKDSFASKQISPVGRLSASPKAYRSGAARSGVEHIRVACCPAEKWPLCYRFMML